MLYIRMSITIKPVIKWVGGKRKIMDKIIGKLPEEFNNYYEPFLGGASVFLNMPFKKKAMINDYNIDLIDLYKNIRDNPKSLLNRLKRIKNKYNKLTDMDLKAAFFKDTVLKINKIKRPSIRRSVLYIFLNKACFNGFMATNKKGQLRPSFGYHDKLKLFDEDNINAFSQLLNKSVKIKNGDYMKFLKTARRGDFVYMDPPYVPDDVTKCNIKYGTNGWTEEKSIELFNLFDELDNRGIYLMMSNSYSKLVRKHFKNKNYKIKKIPIIRTVSVDKNTRGVKYEVLITNY
uniref:site-specific DNA-methyltransferase (adenine-specific) n=1 Tax=viral metagenome TaxID=1070528 RepID=A0A6C0B492_9ZZZZ